MHLLWPQTSAGGLQLPLPLPVHGAVSAAAARGHACARQRRGSAAAAGGFEGWSVVAVWGFFCFVLL